jgi:hypothetical protein
MALSPLFGELKITFIFFLGLPFVLVWLAVRILRDGTPSGKSFEEHFYDDKELVRVKSVVPPSPFDKATRKDQHS